MQVQAEAHEYVHPEQAGPSISLLQYEIERLHKRRQAFHRLAKKHNGMAGGSYVDLQQRIITLEGKLEQMMNQ